MIRILGTAFAGLVGLAFGSFLNVCLSRWPEGESIVRPGSHCRSCGRTLTWWENIPLLSWLVLRGRCRTCGAWIGWRHPIVELAVGLLWSFSTWQFLVDALYEPPFFAYDTLVTFLGEMLLFWLLLALAVLDGEHLWLPDRLTLSGIASGIALYVTHLIFVAHLPTDEYMIQRERYGLSGIFLSRILAIFAAAGLILLIRWLYWLVRRREGIGLGDAKLMAMLAAWLGLPGALLAFAIGVVLGALVGFVILATPKLRQAAEAPALTKLPLGTFLCIGGIVSTLCGAPILAAYLRWSGFS